MLTSDATLLFVLSSGYSSSVWETWLKPSVVVVAGGRGIAGEISVAGMQTTPDWTLGLWFLGCSGAIPTLEMFHSLLHHTERLASNLTVPVSSYFSLFTWVSESRAWRTDLCGFLKCNPRNEGRGEWGREGRRVNTDHMYMISHSCGIFFWEAAFQGGSPGRGREQLLFTVFHPALFKSLPHIISFAFPSCLCAGMKWILQHRLQDSISINGEVQKQEERGIQYGCKLRHVRLVRESVLSWPLQQCLRLEQMTT